MTTATKHFIHGKRAKLHIIKTSVAKRKNIYAEVETINVLQKPQSTRKKGVSEWVKKTEEQQKQMTALVFV